MYRREITSTVARTGNKWPLKGGDRTDDRGGGIWALQVVWRTSGLLQEPGHPAAPLASRWTCVPDASTQSAGWLWMVAVASRVAEMSGRSRSLSRAWPAAALSLDGCWRARHSNRNRAAEGASTRHLHMHQIVEWHVRCDGLCVVRKQAEGDLGRVPSGDVRLYLLSLPVEQRFSTAA